MWHFGVRSLISNNGIALFRIWFWATQSGGVSQYVVYGAIILTGAGGATVLVTSLSMVADLIGSFTVRACNQQQVMKQALVSSSSRFLPLSLLLLLASTHSFTPNDYPA